MSVSSNQLSSDGTPIAMYAWHEAGHAIYAIVKELALSSVWIEKNPILPDAPVHGCIIQKPDSDQVLAAYYMSGPAAESLLGQCNRYDIVAHAMNDYQPLLKMVKDLKISTADSIAWIRAREMDAEQILATHRHAFDAVARELLEKRMMSGNEVAQSRGNVAARALASASTSGLDAFGLRNTRLSGAE